MTVSAILMIIAFICFVLAAIPVASRVNLVALGLAMWSLAIIVGSGLIH